MGEKYGNLRIAHIRTYVNRLRGAILSQGTPEIQEAWEKLEGVVPFLVADAIATPPKDT